MSRSSRQQNNLADGAQLVADFQTALMQRSMTESAEASADYSERAAIAAITDFSARQNGVFIAPGDIPPTSLDAIGRASVDAHLKKAQTSQLKAFTTVQLQELQTTAAHRYTRRRARVTILVPAARPIEGVWRDLRTGVERSSIIKNRQIKGMITELSLERNVILIEPSSLTRAFNGNVAYYLVYPVDPQTLLPAVNITYL